VCVCVCVFCVFALVIVPGQAMSRQHFFLSLQPESRQSPLADPPASPGRSTNQAQM
jgi:hypothetical protein